MIAALLARIAPYLKMFEWIAAFAMISALVTFAIHVEHNSMQLQIDQINAANTATLTKIDQTNRKALKAATDDARAIERRRIEDMSAIDAKHTQELADAKTRADNDLAALRAGTLKLRARFTCPTPSTASSSGIVPQAGTDPGMAGGVQSAQLRDTDATTIIGAGREADTVIRTLLDITNKDRK